MVFHVPKNEYVQNDDKLQIHVYRCFKLTKAVLKDLTDCTLYFISKLRNILFHFRNIIYMSAML